LTRFVNHNLGQDKLATIWFYDAKDAKIKLLFHTISSLTKFNNFMKFGRFPDPNEEIKSDWQVESFPFLVVYTESQ